MCYGSATLQREKEERQKLIEIEKKRKREDAEERRKQAKQWRDEERATAMARSADAAVAQTNDFKRRDRRHIEDLQQVCTASAARVVCGMASNGVGHYAGLLLGPVVSGLVPSSSSIPRAGLMWSRLCVLCCVQELEARSTPA